jgi:hypothetical protein
MGAWLRCSLHSSSVNFMIQSRYPGRRLVLTSLSSSLGREIRQGVLQIPHNVE